MKKIKVTKLSEAYELSAVEKMELFNKGERRENVKACALAKLLTYYDICLSKGFTVAAERIEEELLRRDLPEYILPEPNSLTPEMFTSTLAKFIKECGDGYSRKAIEAAKTSPIIGTTSTETLTVYLLLAMALDAHMVVFDIKRELNSCCVLLYRFMPDVLRKILENTKIKVAIYTAVDGLV
jgi:hypothetical protein